MTKLVVIKIKTVFFSKTINIINFKIFLKIYEMPKGQALILPVQKANHFLFIFISGQFKNFGFR